MSWRRLRVLLEHLPPESAYATALRDSASPEELAVAESRGHGPWSRVDYLLANVVDGVNRLAWMQSDGKTPPPQPYPRPGVETASVTPINEAALAYLLEVERLHGAEPSPDWTPEVNES